MKNKEEHLLTYALDSSGKMVHIGSVKRGLSCNCRCPKCNDFLVAKLGRGRRQPHFAHQKDSDCQGFYTSALHKRAEQIIEEEKAVMAPAYKDIDKQKLEFEKVEVEQRVDRKDLQPDLVGITSDGLRWFIEIRYTHEVDEAKRAKLIESEITCLEIDVREQTLEGLKSFLLESTESREWINNPNYDKIIEDSYRKKVSAIVKQIEAKPELGYLKGDIIILENLSISVSENGLYATIKATSTKGVPYLFHIGSHEVLEHVKPTKESHVLLVDVDKNHFINGYVSLLNMEKLYFYVPKNEIEEEIRKHKDNQEYEVRPIKPKHEKLVVQSQPNNLSFSTIDNSKTEDQPYFDFSVKGLSLQEICNKIEAEKSIKIEGNEVIAVEKIDVRSRNDGIVLLCKCNDRVYPYKVVTAWIENEKLKYNKIANRKGKRHDSAIEVFNYTVKSSIKVENVDQENIYDKNKRGFF